MSGTLETIQQFASDWVAPRRIDVWVPPGYHGSTARYPVLYMHDGQNLFLNKHAFAGVAWDVHLALLQLVAAGEVAPALIVGIWNTPDRIPEYMPQRILTEKGTARFVRRFGKAPCSEDYLWFLVDELKPMIDRTYRTRTGPSDTAVMGSSMGGLISLAAICEYPGVFGGAGCLSPSWTVAGRGLMRYLRAHLPRPITHRLYLDRGMESHLPGYRRLREQVDARIEAAGYERGTSWMSELYPDDPHSEAAWRARVSIPLRFLLTPRPDPEPPPLSSDLAVRPFAIHNGLPPVAAPAAREP